MTWRWLSWMEEIRSVEVKKNKLWKRKHFNRVWWKLGNRASKYNERIWVWVSEASNIQIFIITLYENDK